ncbi:MAG: twin-arginine translocase TatA/TatE family subunit [Armatimonadetes bacterium]|nr:twin-arginine translocase TatA/TatE family subunit [Armatimonadota bacterium]
MKEIMFNLGGTEIAIILIVALLVLGPKQLPGLAKQIGKMMRDFRSMSGDMTRALDLDGHNDYDHAAHRGSSFDYGYNHAAIESSDVAASEFAYSAPVAGTTVAAIDDRPKDDDTITEHGGARVYEEPTSTDTTDTPGDINAPTHTNEGTKI